MGAVLTGARNRGGSAGRPGAGSPAGGNLGRTSLPCRRRAADPMAEHDRLPADLRAFLHGALRPWSPRSVARAFARALAEAGGDRAEALARLRAREAAAVARDAAAVWGPLHPAAAVPHVRAAAGAPAPPGAAPVGARGRRRGSPGRPPCPGR